MTMVTMFAGGDPVIDLVNDSVGDVATSPAVAVATYTLNSNGTRNGGTWIKPTAQMSSYECRVTMLSGSLSSGTVDTWLNLGTTRSFSRNRTTVGTNTASALVEIRHAATGVVKDSATINFSATVDPG